MRTSASVEISNIDEIVKKILKSELQISSGISKTAVAEEKTIVKKVKKLGEPVAVLEGVEDTGEGEVEEVEELEEAEEVEELEILEEGGGICRCP